MPENTIDQTTFKYAVDDGSIRAVKQKAAELDKALGAASDELTRTGTVGKAAMASVERATAEGTRMLATHKDAIEDIREEWLRVEDAAEKAGKAEKKGGGSAGGIGSRITGGIDRIGSTGSQVLSGLGAGEASGIAGLVGDVAGAVGSLSPATLVFTAAAAAAGIALGNAAASTAKVTEATRKRIEAEEAVERFIAEATSRAAQERLDANQRALETEIGILADREREYREFERRVNSNAWDDVREELGLAYGELSGLEAAFNEQAETVEKLVFEQIALNAALEEQAFEANNAATAQEEYNRELAEYNQSRLDNEISILMQLRDMTKQQRDERLDAIEYEMVVLERVAATTTLTMEQFAELGEREGLLRQERAWLLEATYTAADAEAELKQAREAATAQGEEYLESITNEVTAREKLSAATAEYTKAAEESGKKLQAIQDELIAKEAEINAKAEADIVKVQEKAAADREKAIADHEKRVAEIQRRYHIDREKAVAERDAVALEALDKQYEEDIKTEKDSYAERLKELDKALDEQTKAIKTSQDEQIRNAQDAARKAVETERQRYEAEERTRRQAVQQAQANLQNALAQQEIIRGNALNREGVMIAQHMAGTYANIDFWLTAVERRAATMAIGPQPAGGTGDYVPIPGSPFVMPAGFAAGGGGGGAPVINVYSASDMKTIRTTSNREARQVIMEVLRD